MSTIRTCKLRQNNVIMAPERLHRPSQFHTKDTQEDDLNFCPFEKGNEEATPYDIFRLNDSEGEWLTRVVPNLYKALSIEEEKKSERLGFYTQESGLGAHEVIIETPDHYLTMNNYNLTQWHAYLTTITTRIKDLGQDKRLAHVQIFKNQGIKAGATLRHPHSQILATAFIPPMVEREVERQRSYFQKYHRSLLMDIVHEELRERKRVIYENSAFVVFTPFASLYPFEVHIVPKMQCSDISLLQQEELDNLAKALQNAMQKLHKVLGHFDFNLIIKNQPLHSEHPDPHYFYKMGQFFTFYILITPRLYTLAGYELATDMRINPIMPELAAEKLKEV